MASCLSSPLLLGVAAVVGQGDRKPDIVRAARARHASPTRLWLIPLLPLLLLQLLLLLTWPTPVALSVSIQSACSMD